ncbi:MAG: hypothetical protein EBX40_07515 [Gammaproteobacteria bacterium]|nr:hypothetical protein [Gammaproteobacteria bacterium]
MSLPSIINALISIAKFLISLRDKDEVKSCSLAIEDAHKRGDTSKLKELIEKLERGEPCK